MKGWGGGRQSPVSPCICVRLAPSPRMMVSLQIHPYCGH